DALFSPHFFYFLNYYDALCMSPRVAHLEIPYASRDIIDGFGHEDWQWSIETMAAGWSHVIIRNTIVFKRRRDSSISAETEARRGIIWAVGPMAIENILNLGCYAAIVSKD